MVRKTVGEQRIGTHLSSRGNAVWNSYCLLPDGMRVGYFKDSRSRIIEFCEIGEIDMRPHMISAEIVHGIKRTKIELSRDSLAGFDFQGSRSGGIFGCEQRDWLIFISGHLESKP